MLQRIMLYVALGLVLTAIDATIMTWQFWAVLALFWASELLTRKETEIIAAVKGISRYLDMTPAQQKAIQQAHEQDKKAQHG
jgi:hypothetical protein